MKNILTLTIFTLLSIQIPCIAGQSLFDWSFRTGKHVHSAVCIDENMLYAGSFDSIFYALNLNGVEQWRFNAGNPIKCQAVIVDSVVSFQSGNKLFGLNKLNGNKLWVHQPVELAGLSPVIQLDSWDFKDASPIVDKGIVYYGNEYGILYGINFSNGAEVFRFQTSNKAAIRTKPVIYGDAIFFGDQDGFVYAVNITDGALKWSMRTNNGVISYPEFGGIFGDMIIDNEKLYFGIRNSKFQVLDVNTGSIIWSYESGGTWMSGTSVINNGTVYVGTSDSHEIMAFDNETGKLKWKKPVGFGVYNAPVLFDNKLYVFTGDERYPVGIPGNGKILIFDENGKIENALRIKGSVFNTPSFQNGKFYFSSLDSNIHCLSVENITNAAHSEIEMDQSEINIGIIDKKSNVVIPLCYIKNNGNKADSLILNVVSDGLPSSTIKLMPSGYYLPGNDSVQLKAQISTKEIQNGEYKFTVNVSVASSPEFAVEKKAAFSVNIPTGIENIGEEKSLVRLFPNPCGESAFIETDLKEAGKIRFEVHNCYGQLVIAGNERTCNVGKNSILINTGAIPANLYIVRVFQDGNLVAENKLMKK